MTKIHRSLTGRTVRTARLTLTIFALLAGAAILGGVKVSANHTVYVEGNCMDQAVPGPAPGSCGDYDGDGRVGIAEDTDPADNIFGTLTAALGSSGINHNGKIVIVTSGRFSETLYIGQNLGGPLAPGVANPGNVTIEAAPGVEATLDAVNPSDTVANNNVRQGSTGIQVVYTLTNPIRPPRVVTLRNLEVRNFNIGIEGARDTMLDIDNCRVENNLHHGILGIDSARISVTNTQVSATGFRDGSSPFTTPAPGNGITALNTSRVRVGYSSSSKNFNHGIAGLGSNPVFLFNAQTYFNGSGGTGGTNVSGNISACADFINSCAQ